MTGSVSGIRNPLVGRTWGHNPTSGYSRRFASKSHTILADAARIHAKEKK
jgi:hypothetical protein